MTIPDLTRYGLKRRLDQRRRERWTDLGDLESRYRGSFAYVTGTDTDGDPCVPVPAPLPWSVEGRSRMERGREGLRRDRRGLGSRAGSPGTHHRLLPLRQTRDAGVADDRRGRPPDRPG